MESANLHHHHHQLQDQLVGSSSSSLAASPHVWTQNITLSTKNPNSNGVSFMQDLGSHWNTNFDNTATLSLTKHTHHHDHDLQQLSKIKEEKELSADCFPKFIEMINTTSTAATIHQDSHYIKDEHSNYMTDLSDKLLLKTISSGFHINGHRQFCGSVVHSNFGPSRGNFSQTHPSINISNLNRSPPPSITASYNMDLQALDLLTCKRFSGSLDQSCHDNLGVYEDNNVYDLDNLQQSDHFQSCCPNKISSFTTNELTEAQRRSSSLPEPKATVLQPPPKKSRLETRASSPQLKVRKEKLGDRIAALQQLVAPFGKTDTASVLMEAVGYIKFLQNQVETLSVPYMKSSSNKSSTSAQAEGTDEPRGDLRGRGLCLVPSSCMSYLTGGDGGGGIWPPSKYFGGP